MAPRTRKSQRLQGNQVTGGLNASHASLDQSMHANTTNEADVISQDIDDHRVQVGNQTLPQNNLIGNGKHTLASLSDSPGTRPVVQPTPAKKARNIGPARGRPMQLQLTSESEIARQPQSGGVAGVSRGGKRVVQRTSSFYPGRTNVFDPEPRFHPTPRDYESYPTTEEDSNNEEDMASLTEGHLGKIHEAMATERPSWPDSATSARPPLSVSRTVSTETMSSSNDTSLGINSPTVPVLPPAATIELPLSQAWPADTNLVFARGGTRVLLTIQRPLIRAVIQDAIEDLRASLTFNNAFPDGILVVSFIRHSLNTAAEDNCPAASSICRRLLHDEDYVLKIVPVLRARIPLFRSEVKERCNLIVLAEFLSMVPADIVRSVEWQCLGYHYIYLKPLKGIGSNNLVMRSKPYRNKRIILAIRDLYLTGGSTSFAMRYNQLFPSTTGDDGMIVCEVPIPMVALVATALYASLYEWRTGSQLVTEFSTTAYFEVYQSHVNTLQLIQEKRGNVFHSMMADIYSQASNTASDGASGSGTPGPMVQLDLDSIE